MGAQEPEIAELADRRLGAGHLIGINQAGRRRQLDALLAGDRLEQGAHLLVFALDGGEQLLQLLTIGRGHRGNRVERGQDERLLVLGEGDVDHGDGGLALRAGKFDAQVAVDETAGGGVDHDRLHETDLSQHAA